MHRFTNNSSTRLHVGLLLVAGSALVSCAEEPSPQTTVVAPTPGDCGEGGYLSATLYGSIDQTLDWRDAELACESMLRPNGEGVRFRFTGDAAQRVFDLDRRRELRQREC